MFEENIEAGKDGNEKGQKRKQAFSIFVPASGSYFNYLVKTDTS